MDRKIREAAENDIQNYQERDWNGMEVLLDKHLPQKKRRRGIIVFFLLAALSVSGYLLVSSVSSSRRPIAQEEEITTPKATDKTQSATQDQTVGETGTIRPVNDKNPEKQNKNLNAPELPSEKLNTSVSSTAPEKKNNTIISISDNPNLNNSDKGQYKQPVSVNRNQVTGNNYPSKTQKEMATANDPVIADKIISPVIGADKNEPALKSVAPATDNQQTAPANDLVIKSQNTIQPTQQPAAPVTENKEAKAEPVTDVANKPAKKERLQKSFASKLILSASAGPDYSSVKFKQSGEVKLNYGIGVGYQLNDRFTIRTGLYAGSKVYTANAKSYKTPYQTGPYSYRLTSVDANCYVVEVPLNLVYNFKTAKNHNWFASAGLSSYFMKKEDYLYTYTNPTGDKYSHLWEFRNDNKHPFSVLGLSAGYQYTVNKRFSLLAEPYLKMPLGGVGDGKVKLNNTGVMFTAAWKPFKK